MPKPVYRQLPREVPDDLWELIEPLIPPERSKPKGGRPTVPARTALNGILFVLRSGCRWKDLPPVYSSGSTCHLRLTQWHRAGVWEKLWTKVLGFLDREGKIDWERTALDAAKVPAPRGVRTPAPTRRTERNLVASVAR